MLESTLDVIGGFYYISLDEPDAKISFSASRDEDGTGSVAVFLPYKDYGSLGIETDAGAQKADPPGFAILCGPAPH